jgi:hypothetical protein
VLIIGTRGLNRQPKPCLGKRARRSRKPSVSPSRTHGPSSTRTHKLPSRLFLLVSSEIVLVITFPCDRRLRTARSYLRYVGLPSASGATACRHPFSSPSAIRISVLSSRSYATAMQHPARAPDRVNEEIMILTRLVFVVSSTPKKKCE